MAVCRLIRILPSVLFGLRGSALPTAVFARAHTGMLLEILAEKGLCGEIQLIADLLNRLIRITQQRLGLLDDEVVDHFGGRLPHDAFYRQRQVLGTEAEFVRIELDGMLLFVMFGDEKQKIATDGFRSAMLAVGFGAINDQIVQK